jgi:hypothetical protein
MKKMKSEIDEYIGSRIREYRLSLRLTQEQLASIPDSAPAKSSAPPACIGAVAIIEPF